MYVGLWCGRASPPPGPDGAAPLSKDKFVVNIHSDTEILSF